MRLRIYRYLLERKPLEDGCPLHGPYSATWDESLDTKTPEVGECIDVQHFHASVRRHPKILGVNHQIYFEAFSVLYSRPGVIDPSKGIWRYIPTKVDNQEYYHGEGELDLGIFDVDYVPCLPHGSTKPPKLARFSKVLLLVRIDGILDWMYDEENGRLPIQVQQKSTEYLRSLNVIEDFVELLAGCSWVDHVDIDIRLEARFLVGNDIDSDFPIEGWAAELDARKKIRHKGDIQVADIFLTSGTLAPLRRVSNVRSWCIELRVESAFEGPLLCIRR